MRRLRLVIAGLVAALASFAAASVALAYSPPPPRDGEFSGLRVIVQPTGAAIVGWSRFSAADRTEQPLAAARAVEGDWAVADPGLLAPAMPTLPAHPFDPPWKADGYRLVDALGDRVVAGSMDVGPSGHAIALWLAELTAKDPVLEWKSFEWRQVRAADRLPDGTWSAPYALGPFDAGREVQPPCACGPSPDLRPAIAVDATGGVVATWTNRLAPPGGSVVLWSARPAGGTWSIPAVLDVDSLAVRLETSSTGETVAAWVRGGRLRSASRPAGGVFGPAADLGPAEWSTEGWPSPRLSIDTAGRALLVWPGSWTQILAASRQPGGGWSAPTDLTALVKPAPPEPPVVKQPLLVRVGLSRSTLRRSVPTVLRFRLGSAGEVRVIVQRRGRGKAVRSLRVAAGAGDHRISLFASRPLPPGRYTVKVRVTADGQEPVTATKRLLVQPA